MKNHNNLLKLLGESEVTRFSRENVSKGPSSTSNCCRASTASVLEASSKSKLLNSADERRKAYKLLTNFFWKIYS